MKRIVVLIETKKGVVYELDKPTAEGRIVAAIEYRRDGLLSINHGDGDHSHYLLDLINPVSEEDVIFRAVPYSEIREITFVMRKDSKDEVPETTTAMKRV